MKSIISNLLFVLVSLGMIFFVFLWIKDRHDYDGLLVEAAIEKFNIENEVKALENGLSSASREIEIQRSSLDRSLGRVDTLERFIERSQNLGRIRTAYLTIDDGPTGLTEEFLQVLKEKNVPATFFVIGSQKPEDEELYRRMINEGHELGNHTFSHIYSDLYSGRDRFWADVHQLDSYLEDVVGFSPRFFRFPGGSNNGQAAIFGGGTALLEILKNELEAEGFTYFDWNVYPYDTDKLKTVQEMAELVRS